LDVFYFVGSDGFTIPRRYLVYLDGDGSGNNHPWMIS
jgi:hypothetical protein